jgi:hypothetical protein
MMRNYMEIMVSADFDTTTEGILGINNGNALVDESIFDKTPIFTVIEKFLETPVSDIKIKKFKNILDELGENTKSGNSDIILDYKFDPDNSYDIKSIVYNRSNPIVAIYFRNSPVSGVAIFDEDPGVLRITMSPYTKDYYTMETHQWIDFVKILKGHYSINYHRSRVLSTLLDDVSNTEMNLLRHLQFIAEYGNSDRFYNSIWDYYCMNGEITEKQKNSLISMIWRK